MKNSLFSVVQHTRRSGAESGARVADGSPNAVLGMVGQQIREILGPIRKGQTQSYVSSGRWSAHDLLNYILRHTGSATVYASTYALSEESTRAIVRKLQQGEIQEMHCILDGRMKVRKPAVLHFAEKNFTRLVKRDCHAKVMVIRNENWSVTVISSMNFSSNKRIEAGVIFTDRATADFHQEWMEAELEGGKPFGR